jgi:hypothetical protein
MATLAAYCDGTAYTQHNPRIGDGLSGLEWTFARSWRLSRASLPTYPATCSNQLARVRAELAVLVLTPQLQRLDAERG